MVFDKLFGRQRSDSREEGKRLFELGMNSASEFRSNEALNYYTKSIEASENPSPYINRANLLGKRIRHLEALQDLLLAQRIDLMQGKQFQSIIAQELARNSILTSNYVNGIAQKLVADLKEKGERFVAARILCTSFGIPQIQWDHGLCNNTKMLEFHLFNDLDNIMKFDDIERYPEAQELIDIYPITFIEMKVNNCPNLRSYETAETKLHNFLCSYPEEDMVYLRRNMHYDIHEKLIRRDFGDRFDARYSECLGVIKEAEPYLK